MNVDKEHAMRINSIIGADAWFESLPLQEQYHVKELAARMMSQGIVMAVWNGDRRPGIEMFPDAWAVIHRCAALDWKEGGGR